jgi:hypothetical protein
MNADELHPANRPHRGTMLLGVAAAAAIGVLWTALAVPGADADERGWVDTAPSTAPAPTATARLDDGVDWSRVEAAPDAAPMAVAAYER